MIGIVELFLVAFGSINVGVQDLLCSVTPQQKARWFRDAFSIPRLSWKTILKAWLSHLPQSSYSVTDEADGDSVESTDGMNSEQEQVSVIPDPSSELIQSPELWFTMWHWLPDWVICKEPLCVFRASRDGYKYVKNVCLIQWIKALSAHARFRRWSANIGSLITQSLCICTVYILKGLFSMLLI